MSNLSCVGSAWICAGEHSKTLFDLQAHVLPDGRIQASDCKGKTSVVDPSASSDPTDNVSASQTHASGDVPVSSKLSQAREQYEIANLEYQQQQFKRNEAVFAWQDTSSKFMFFLVVLIVLTGLVLAALKFREAAQTELEAGKEGFKLKTTIVGVVILSMSMVFLYLYLFFVYPIKNVGQ